NLGKMPLILIVASDGLGRVWLPIWVNLGFCTGNVAKLEEPFMDCEWGNLQNDALPCPVYAIVELNSIKWLVLWKCNCKVMIMVHSGEQKDS
ncbi:hypothetical protein Tco_1275546, partial [Tanacetum coccineum]